MVALVLVVARAVLLVGPVDSFGSSTLFGLERGSRLGKGMRGVERSQQQFMVLQMVRVDFFGDNGGVWAPLLS